VPALLRSGWVFASKVGNINLENFREIMVEDIGFRDYSRQNFLKTIGFTKNMAIFAEK